MHVALVDLQFASEESVVSVYLNHLNVFLLLLFYSQHSTANSFLRNVNYSFIKFYEKPTFLKLLKFVHKSEGLSQKEKCQP